VNVELRIEELVLHGFAARDRRRIGAATQRELTRLFAEKGVPPSLARGTDVPSLEAGALKVPPGAGAEAVGSRIARALYGGMERPQHQNGGSRR
jgi:hypothetical protein